MTHEQIKTELRQECNRLLYGHCETLRCMRNARYTADSTATNGTCVFFEAYGVVEEMDRQADALVTKLPRPSVG